jgi:hypothetical protein
MNRTIEPISQPKGTSPGKDSNSTKAQADESLRPAKH